MNFILNIIKAESVVKSVTSERFDRPFSNFTHFEWKQDGEPGEHSR